MRTLVHKTCPIVIFCSNLILLLGLIPLLYHRYYSPCPTRPGRRRSCAITRAKGKRVLSATCTSVPTCASSATTQPGIGTTEHVNGQPPGRAMDACYACSCIT